MIATVSNRYDEMLLRGAVATQVNSRAMVEQVRRLAESHVVWFAVVLPLVVLAGIAIFAYLTVQCWNRGFSGFSGQFSRSDGWFSATIRFWCF